MANFYAYVSVKHYDDGDPKVRVYQTQAKKPDLLADKTFDPTTYRTWNRTRVVSVGEKVEIQSRQSNALVWAYVAEMKAQ